MSTVKKMSFRAALIWSAILITAVSLTGMILGGLAAVWPNLTHAQQFIIAIAWCVFAFAVVIWAMANHEDDPDDYR